jgi:hypothetical protein
MIEYIVTLASGFMYKFNQHNLYTEQTVSQQIIHTVWRTNFISYTLYQEQIVLTIIKIV